MNLSRRKFLVLGGLATVGAAAATIETLPLLRGSDGGLQLHLQGTRTFAGKVPYDCQVKAVYPYDPEIRIHSEGEEVTKGSVLRKGASLSVTSPIDNLDLTIQVRRL
jgi:hypothetical protein